MTVEQYKQLRKNLADYRKETAEYYSSTTNSLIEKFQKEGKTEAANFLIKNNKIPNFRLKLPNNQFTKKIRASFEEMIINDIAAVEETCAANDVENLQSEMEKVIGFIPKSYCYIGKQDISDIRNGSFYLGWRGDVKLIKSILKRNGLKVTHKDENTKLLVEEEKLSHTFTN